MTSGDVWDVTAAAPTHAGLAGVLAGIVLAVLAIILSSPDDGDSTTLYAQVVPPLLTSFIFLVVSAVIWGGLSGYPPIPDLIENPTAASDAVQAKAGVVAASGVTLLAMGALSFLAAMLEVVRVRVADVGPIVRFGFPALAALAMHQVAVFTLTSTWLLWELPSASSINVIALLCLAAALTIGVALRSWLGRRPPRGKTWAAALTGVLAAGAFSLVPVDQSGTLPPAVGPFDHMSGAMLVGAALSFAVYALLASGAQSERIAR